MQKSAPVLQVTRNLLQAALDTAASVPRPSFAPLLCVSLAGHSFPRSIASLSQVTLVLPWLSRPDQDRVFPGELRFDTPEQQEAYVVNWARQRTGLACNFKIKFYPGRYAAEKGAQHGCLAGSLCPVHKGYCAQSQGAQTDVPSSFPPCTAMYLSLGCMPCQPATALWPHLSSA
jgi:hypothetical protein